MTDQRVTDLGSKVQGVAERIGKAEGGNHRELRALAAKGETVYAKTAMYTRGKVYKCSSAVVRGGFVLLMRSVQQYSRHACHLLHPVPH